MAFKISTIGLKELQARMKRLETSLEPKDVTPILVRALELIRERAVENLERQGSIISGGLIRSMITRPGKSTTIASAWTKAGAKTPGVAPHAHLVEFGHRIVGPKPNKKDTGKVVQGKPFFRPAVDAMRAQVRNTINEGIVKLLWDASK